MRRSLWLLLLTFACGGGDLAIDNTHPICAALTVVPAQATPEEHAAVADALEMWRRAGHTGLTLDPTAEARLVTIRFEDAAPIFRGVYDDEHGVVYVNHELPDRRARAVTVAHELGHVFGLAHVGDGRASVMNEGNLTVEPTRADWLDAMALAAGCAQ